MRRTLIFTQNHFLIHIYLFHFGFTWFFSQHTLTRWFHSLLWLHCAHFFYPLPSFCRNVMWLFIIFSLIISLVRRFFTEFCFLSSILNLYKNIRKLHFSFIWCGAVAISSLLVCNCGCVCSLVRARRFFVQRFSFIFF